MRVFLVSSATVVLLGVLSGLSGCSGKTVSYNWPGGSGAGQPRDRFSTNALFRTSAWLFDDSKVWTMRITIKQSIFNDVVMWVYRNADGKVYGLAERCELNGEVISNVGMRSRGNTSIRNAKRQFKLSFNCDDAYTNAQQGHIRKLPALAKRRFHGVKKINLRASQNDPTILREKLSSWVFQQIGVPAPRVGFVRLYINGSYWGLYLLVEQIDDCFLESRFGHGSGNLYKGVAGASAFDVEKMRRGFELKTNEGRNDWRDLYQFFTALDKVRTREEIESLVNVDNVLGYLAGAALVGHWDSFAWLQNNDYLYHHRDGRFRIIVWDMDNTFGSGIGWGFPALDSSAFAMRQNTNYWKLFSKLLGDTLWRTRYRRLLERALATWFNEKAMFSLIDKYRDLIRSAVLSDPRKHYDWRYPTQAEANRAWEAAFDQYPPGWRGRGFQGGANGLKDWISKRIRNVRLELEGKKQGK